MKIIIAPDSFKGSMSSIDAARCIDKGLNRAGLSDNTLIPMADGGEGTVEALMTATGGRQVTCTVTGPLGDPVEAFYGILGDGETAVIEMAAASGLPLVPQAERNPLLSTTYGTGELLKHAVESGCTKLIIGIGGSATNDGGAGMAMALGAQLLDQDGNPIQMGGAGLASLHHIDMSGIPDHYRCLDIQVACDVNNPLCGEQGASAVYGPQKGATPQMVETLDAALDHFASVVKKDLGKDILDMPGAGAAGGLGGGLVAFLNAQLKSGIEIVTQATGMDDLISSADLVITGEGQSDEQTAYGKVPAGIAAIAKKYHKPLICISGGLGDSYEALYDIGITACYSLCDRPMSLDTAMMEAPQLMERCAHAIGRMIASIHSR